MTKLMMMDGSGEKPISISKEGRIRFKGGKWVIYEWKDYEHRPTILMTAPTILSASISKAINN